MRGHRSEMLSFNTASMELRCSEVLMQVRGQWRLSIAAVAMVAMVAMQTFASVAVAQVSTGTGFAVSASGHIVTNHHVIDDAIDVRVRTLDGESLQALIVATDPANDLAVLKVGRRFSPLALRSSSEVRRGASVLTIGFPQVSIQGIEPKVTQGIVSALSGLKGDPRVFQVQVPVQPGNSGGPLVGDDGSVIGVISSRLNSVAVLRETGSLPEGVSYAIKSNYLLELLNSVSQSEALKIRRAVGLTRLSTPDVVGSIERSVVFIVARTGSAASTAAPPKSPIRDFEEYRCRKVSDASVTSIMFNLGLKNVSFDSRASVSFEEKDGRRAWPGEYGGEYVFTRTPPMVRRHGANGLPTDTWSCQPSP